MPLKLAAGRLPEGDALEPVVLQDRSFAGQVSAQPFTF